MKTIYVVKHEYEKLFGEFYNNQKPSMFTNTIDSIGTLLKLDLIYKNAVVRSIYKYVSHVWSLIDQFVFFIFMVILFSEIPTYFVYIMVSYFIYFVFKNDSELDLF
jgi:hypothetical protein